MPAHRHVDCDYTETNERQGIPPLRSLRSITQRKQEAQNEETKVEVIEDDVENVYAITKIERRIFHSFTEDNE